MTRLLGLLAAAVWLAVSCSGGGDTLVDIGIERSSVGLVFKEDKKDGPKPDVEEAFVPRPGPSQGTVATKVDPSLAPPSISPSAAACPKAGPGVFPTEPVSVAITKAPRPGVYPYRSEGRVKVEGASTRLDAPLPPESRRELKLLQPVGSEELYRFDVIQRGLQDAVTTTTYRVTETTFDLVRTHTVNPRGTSTFQPQPPVTLVRLGQGEGNYWNSAGFDPTDGTAMLAEGRIVKRENIDVCGKVFDTYRVESDETMVNLFTGFRYETTEPTVYNIATHLGGIFLREDVKATTTIRTAQGDLLVHADYVSTAMSATPAP